MAAPHPTLSTLVVSLLLLGCGDSALPAPVPDVAMSANPAADGQEGVAGYPLPLPVRVEVRVDGVPTPGIMVHWTTQGGSLVPAVGVTDANGIASADWTLGVASGPVTATARITEPAVKTVTLKATAIEEVAVARVPWTVSQSAEVGTALPQPVQVRVTKSGAPRAGVPVHWTVLGGSITETSVTDADGIASAIWTMPTNPPGPAVARATVRGDRGGPHIFQANALIGPPAQVVVLDGNNQTLLAHADAFRPLAISVRDRFGNSIAGVPVSWAVEQGPVELDETDDVTGPTGQSRTSVTRAGESAGSAVVRAQVGSGLVARFGLAVDAQGITVLFDTFSGVFVSARNGSSPAVDTVSVATTVTWRLTVFDYEDHAVVGVGTPELPGGGLFSYATPSIVQVRFTAAGSYRYTDPFTGATGTVVVR